MRFHPHGRAAGACKVKPPAAISSVIEGRRITKPGGLGVVVFAHTTTRLCSINDRRGMDYHRLMARRYGAWVAAEGNVEGSIAVFQLHVHCAVDEDRG